MPVAAPPERDVDVWEQPASASTPATMEMDASALLCLIFFSPFILKNSPRSYFFVSSAKKNTVNPGRFPIEMNACDVSLSSMAYLGAGLTPAPRRVRQ